MSRFQNTDGFKTGFGNGGPRVGREGGSFFKKNALTEVEYTYRVSLWVPLAGFFPRG
jgi:hypothetical protein